MDDAKDIVHQVYTALWEKRNSLHLDTSIRSYLYTAVQNRSLNYLRDKKKFVDNELPETIESLNSMVNDTDFIESEELKLKIHEALQLLPEGSRKVFIMSKFNNMKYREIAEELEISIKTVETHMSKSLKHMRETLGKFLGLISIILAVVIKILN